MSKLGDSCICIKPLRKSSTLPPKWRERFSFSCRGGPVWPPGCLFVDFRIIRPTQQVIHADVVIVRQLDENVDWIIQYADLILRIRILLYVDYLGNLFLCQSTVNPQIADIFKFQNFITHFITRYEHSTSENKILCFILFSDIMPHEVMIMPDYKKMYLHLFNHVSDALEALEQQNFDQAKEILIAAQQQAEDEYVESE